MSNPMIGERRPPCYFCSVRPGDGKSAPGEPACCSRCRPEEAPPSSDISSEKLARLDAMLLDEFKPLFEQDEARRLAGRVMPPEGFRYVSVVDLSELIELAPRDGCAEHALSPDGTWCHCCSADAAFCHHPGL